MAPQPTAWLAAHLYYAEPWETFLIRAVRPFVARALAQPGVRQYFFIRYWERGPHVRLRFGGDAAVLEERIKPALLAHFGRYFEQFPSRRVEPAWTHDLPPGKAWFPNHSVQFIPYEPETERYGGPAALAVAEKQFEASSDAVLALLAENSGWQYSRALGAAIQLHLGFAHALGMRLAEVGAFFAGLAEAWLPRAYPPYDAPPPAEDLENRRREVLGAFGEAFSRQRSVLLPLFIQVWEALEAGDAFEEAWFTGWLREMRGIGQQLRHLQAAGQLVPPVQLPPGTAAPFTDAQRDRWLLYDSYVHMTNNRLGILNRDEGYLGYLLGEGLREMLAGVH